MSILFQLSSWLVLPFWLAMIFAPSWRWTSRLMRSPFVIVAPAVLYAIFVLPRLAQIGPAVANPSLAGISALLASPVGVTIAWVHFLAFDLFVGRWIFLDSRERQLSAFLMAPVLLLTLLLGPLGFLTYLAVRSFRHLKRPLAVTGGLTLITLLATLIGIMVDPRVITGAPAWEKPAKFAISITIYCFTFEWLLTFVKDKPRLTQLAANVTSVCLIVEMILIAMQAARGTTSHFNIATPFDTVVWTSMGAFISVAFSAALLLATLLIRQNMPDRAFALSLRLGVIVSLVGMSVAFLMTAPTHQQFETMAHRRSLAIAGAHTVGTADGGPGLPWLGWSTVSGDLRVPHFVGLHALQVLPLLGWLLMRKGSITDRLDESHRIALVWIAGATYLLVVLLLVLQAERAEPVLRPDAIILTAAAGVALAALSCAGAVIVSGVMKNRAALAGRHL